DFALVVSIPISVMVLGKESNLPTSVVGGIISIGYGGSIVGAFIAPCLKRFLNTGILIVLSLAGQALCLLLVAISRHVILIAALIIAINLMMSIFDVTQRSYRINRIPSNLQGRVNSIYRLLLFGGTPLSFALSGILLDHFGSSITFVGFGVCVA